MIKIDLIFVTFAMIATILAASFIEKQNDGGKFTRSEHKSKSSCTWMLIYCNSFHM